MKKITILIMLSIMAFFTLPAQALNLDKCELDKIQYFMPALQNYVNNNIPDKLYDRSGIDVGHRTKLQLRVYRNGNASLSFSNMKLSMQLPIIFDARGDWYTKVAFAKVRHHEDTSGSLTVLTETTIRESGNTLTPATTASFTWNERPYIDVGPARIRISGIAGEAIQNQLNKLATELNSKLTSKLNEIIRNPGQSCP